MYLDAFAGKNPELVSAIEAAYPLGEAGLRTPYDQLSAIVTDYIFQCPAAKWVNDTASIGIPAWRYYFNASFANTQPYPGLGVFHSSEIPMIFGTYRYNALNTTTQEYALSNAMQSAWARFAKNPAGGPGWNGVGTGQMGNVLVGANGTESGGLLLSSASAILPGSFDLGLFGDRGEVPASGVTVIDQAEVDYRCGVFEGILDTIAGTSGQTRA